MTPWQDIESAPKDGTPILALVGGASGRWDHLNGRAFVISHQGKTSTGFDLGWSVYPGFGGADDAWFTHWREIDLPTPPVEGEDGLSQTSPSAHASSEAATVEPCQSELAAARISRLEAVLLHIAETDWHYRTPPKPRPDGGLRGWAGRLAVRTLTGQLGSHTTNADVRAAIAEAANPHKET